MRRLTLFGALLGLLCLGVAASAAPTITFNLPDDALVAPSDFSAFGIPGLALVQFQVDASVPLVRMTVQGFFENLSVRLGGNNGHASGGLFWYTPIFARYFGPGEYDMTVTATDASGARMTRTLHLHLLP
jgi:hypothetical protein